MKPRQVEIERKWLVDDPPDLSNRKGVPITQGYVAVTTDGTEVRLRRKGNKHFETIKQGTGLRRREREIELTKRKFDLLWPATLGHRLEKIRYSIKWGGEKIEVDVYKKQLAGLRVAEVEFQSRKQARKFSPPSWFGKEITEEPRYKNVNLAKRKKRKQA